ncbi:unnamed protein product [Schistosoma rodhaini]|uniref:ANK_REP_REGION domain-containing protein n=1 Tax=Schistosoma rodhaini TaxID=6188 RepID=A0AA85FTZ6_9TREM|nr:unnamed protein product [Schistosoma rodhaini]CAH8562974.1 unnamed protein product [Schistosoma rodhaini]
MFLLTRLSEISKPSISERYDKVNLLSNSYSFLWETNSLNPPIIKSNQTNVNFQFMCNFKLSEKLKYKAFFLFLYNKTKHKIEKTFNTIQLHNKMMMVKETNNLFNKEIDNLFRPTQMINIDNNEYHYHNKRYKANLQENIMDSKSKDLRNDNSLKSINTLYNSGCIIHRKHIRYRKWNNQIKRKQKTRLKLKTEIEKSGNLNDDMEPFHHSKCSFSKVISYDKTLDIYKQFLFSQAINDNQWESFIFLINSGININSIQKMMKLINNQEDRKQGTIIKEIYPSVIDLFLRNIPLNQSSNVPKTVGIYSIILSYLLNKGANIHMIDTLHPYICHGGIQLNTLSYLCEQTAIQLDNSFQMMNITNNDPIIDHAGLLRQLLNSGLIPTKLFFLIYTDKLLLFNIKKLLIFNNINLSISNTNQLYKNQFYPLLINKLVIWNINNNKQQSIKYFPIILQSFIILFFNFIYSGLCKLPENFNDILHITYLSSQNNKTKKTSIIDYHQYLFYFIYYHNKFLKIINKQPFSLFVQCRYTIRNYIGTKYFNKKLMNPDHILDTNIQSSNNKFYRQLIKLPDQLKQAIGYMEIIHLKKELYALTQIK